MYQPFLDFKKDFPFLNFKLYFLLILALCFRLPEINAVLEGDELAMISLWSQMPYEKIFQNYQYPNNHIFLTIILSFLLKSFGLYEWLLRIPTLICGVLSIFLAFKAGKTIGKDSFVGWMAACFLVQSEWHIFFSTNARGYLVIMLIAQICFTNLLGRLKESPKFEEPTFQPIKFLLEFTGWLLIWTVASWTLPTFIFFELSLVLFFSGIIIARGCVAKKSILVFLVPFLSLLTGLAVFYLQYYIWISPEMLKLATSNAAQTPLNSFFGEVLIQWLAPFNSMNLVFLVLAFTGGWVLWKRNPSILFLTCSILIGPIFAGILGFQLNLLPGMPHARTYFYLQPFFIILVAVGIYLIGEYLNKSLKLKLGELGGRKLTASVIGIIFLVMLSISVPNTYQNIFLKRVEREPLNRLLNFVQSLDPKDLFIVPDDLHVEFYLYGADEMRQRVINILREGEIGKVYFLEYNKKGNPSFIVNKENKYIEIAGFPPLVKLNANKFPALPQQALMEIDRFGPFGIHQVKPEWLKKTKTWKGSLETVGVIGENFFKWSNSASEKDTQHKISFVDTFLVAVKKKELNAPNSLVLNLMNVSGSDMDFSAEILEGKLMDKQIKYNPTWRINGWTLDHPYGTTIFNRAWNPSISLSMGASTISVLDVQFFKKKNAGIIKEVLSYEISMPENILNLKVNKT